MAPQNVCNYYWKHSRHNQAMTEWTEQSGFRSCPSYISTMHAKTWCDICLSVMSRSYIMTPNFSKNCIFLNPVLWYTSVISWYVRQYFGHILDSQVDIGKTLPRNSSAIVESLHTRCKAPPLAKVHWVWYCRNSPIFCHTIYP